MQRQEGKRMNYMEQVAQMLGVELNEEFIIRNEGDKCRLTERGLEYLYEPYKKWVTCFFLNKILNGTFEIVKISKPILDDKEKEYLSHIIKPFKEKIMFIRKSEYGEHKEYIDICYCEDEGTKYTYGIEFPSFKKGTMYKGMELDKQYTLEELGL